MPNGGVPIHLILRPKEGDVVLHVQATVISVYERQAWDQHGAKAKPICRINTQESQVVGRFLRYWLHDTGDGPIYSTQGVEVEYDF